MENENEPKEGLNNILTVRIIEKYLAYCSGIIKTSLKEGSESYDAQNLYKEIGDELIITPEELVALIDRVQVALDKVD
jgi:hypothetical protein